MSMKKIDLKRKKKNAVVVENGNLVNATNKTADYSELEKSSLEEMQKVRKTINKIKQQNPFQVAFSRRKNEKALAENQEIISNIIKNILNWLVVITSAEMVRKDEYDSLTNQLLQLDEDVNEQLDSQVKFKKAYQNLKKMQDEQNLFIQESERMKKENQMLKIISTIAIVLAIISLIMSVV